MAKELTVKRGASLDVRRVKAAIERAELPEEIIRIEAQIEAVETYMRKSGLGLEKIWPVNEARMLARWRLGQLLAKMVRAQPGPRSGKDRLTGLTQLLRQIGLTKPIAHKAERIGMLPRDELEAAFAEARQDRVLVTFAQLVRLSSPLWIMAKRHAKHVAIKERAALVHSEPGSVGPFALIYADPPWVFETYTPDNNLRMPDDHYPTMTDAEIVDFKVFGRSLAELAFEDCALFMWCTSSNLKRALAVLEGWGFEYKTHAVWDKEKIGLGLIFRNQHELLLYGSRGSPSKPMVVPSSVFRYPRTVHSAKPLEVRRMLEAMYPMFDADTRIELFCRGAVEGWASYGYESANRTAA